MTPKRSLRILLLCASLLSLIAPGQAQEPSPAAAQSAPVTQPAETAQTTQAAQDPQAAGTAGTAGTAGATGAAGAECLVCRWLELENVKISTRYLFGDNSEGQTTAKQNQHQEAIEGRFKFDRSGKVSIHFGLFSGNNFAGGWNDTGWGRGQGSANLYLKQLYLVVQPVDGVQFQYGSFGVLNGESTAITGYANDGYLVGERVVVERPEELFFDRIAVTYAYLGDYFTPNLNKRYHRLKESNYHQFLVGKKIGRRAAISADYSFRDGIETLREAVGIKTGELRVIDTLRFENYQRTDVRAAYGFAVSGEKKVLSRLTLTGGVAQVDPNFGPFNDDAFFDGRRLFLGGQFEICPEFSISLLYNRALANDYAVENRTHFHVAVHYDLLKSLRRTGIF